jgi:lipoate-protein ligase A
MKLLELTLTGAAENLALDEALLDAAEEGLLVGDVLRLWESVQAMVVVGRSSRVRDEVNLENCQAANVPVLRRASGGAAIVTGRGCLMYSLVMSYAGRERLRLLDEVHRHVLGIVAKGISTLVDGVNHVGTSDLAIGGRKFSGNSVRCKRDHFLYHGTLLYDFDLPLISHLLSMPPRQPDYRGGRGHEAFVRNLSVDGAALRSALTQAFKANEPLHDLPLARTQQLASERYATEQWNLQR